MLHRVVINKAVSAPPWWEFTSLTRLGDGDGGLTPAGRHLAELVNGVTGALWLGVDDMFTAKVRPVHTLLRAWSEIEPEVVAAFAAVWEVEPHHVEVVRAPVK